MKFFAYNLQKSCLLYMASKMPSSKLHRIFRGYARIFRWFCGKSLSNLSQIKKKTSKWLPTKLHWQIRAWPREIWWSFDDGIFNAICKWAFSLGFCLIYLGIESKNGPRFLVNPCSNFQKTFFHFFLRCHFNTFFSFSFHQLYFFFLSSEHLTQKIFFTSSQKTVSWIFQS